ncbi:hypothetical protein [Thiolapillus brandeum]|uniref:hypothetical protein n=1 Tax=Thiolapillus brandeum TaxID=1076588 RepID=UPI000597E853|nr:hypothetical protein [Thiolapillus brandeum]
MNHTDPKTCIPNPFLTDTRGKALKLAVWLVRHSIYELHFRPVNAAGDDQHIPPDLFRAAGTKVISPQEKQP